MSRGSTETANVYASYRYSSQNSYNDKTELDFTGESDYSMHNSILFVEHLRQIKMNEKDFMISYDAISLIINV